ncbi:hypothetical protein YPPY52_3695, partial [Yersinia pestis PY-52]
MASDHNG